MPQLRGFALMNKERLRVVAASGGTKAHAMKKAHRFTHAEAVAAGRKGGLSTSKSPAHMREIGARGGKTVVGEGKKKKKAGKKQLSFLEGFGFSPRRGASEKTAKSSALKSQRRTAQTSRKSAHHPRRTAQASRAQNPKKSSTVKKKSRSKRMSLKG
jgi:hypothetical protein